MVVLGNKPAVVSTVGAFGFHIALAEYHFAVEKVCPQRQLRSFPRWAGQMGSLMRNVAKAAKSILSHTVDHTTIEPRQREVPKPITSFQGGDRIVVAVTCAPPSSDIPLDISPSPHGSVVPLLRRQGQATPVA